LYASVIASFLFYAYILVSDRKKLKGSQWSIVAGLSLPVLFMVLFIIFNFKGYNSNNWQLLLTGVYFSFPLSLLVYISLRFREIIRETQEKAHQVVEITKEREEQVLKQQKIHKESLELEAQALRAQMNPHFIYNCMNSIKALIQNNEKRQSIEYLTSFSKLIRTLFQNSDKRQISLYDEIETCRLYVQLESMRLNGKLKYDFSIDPNLDLKSVMVPALIIQPFIENAIWHGIVPKDGGAVSISVNGNDEAIICEVDDDGIGREMSRLNKPITPVIHESKGVHLSQKRLHLQKMLNDTNASIETIDKHENSFAAGTKVRLTFNLS
jgi:sensor histidine kinase YesM